MRKVVRPLEEAGAARVEWVEGVETEGGVFIRLVAERDDATGVEIGVGEDWITLTLGVGYDHEILVDPTYEWEWHFGACLEAIVGGRYREVFVPGASSSTSSSRGATEPHGLFAPDPRQRSLSMIFEVPGENLDFVETFYGPLEGIEERLPGGERRYPPYLSAWDASEGAGD